MPLGWGFLFLHCFYASMLIDHDNPDSIVAYTDGSCYPNPDGDGGWAFHLTHKGKRICRYGFHRPATNNLMEITAVLKVLQNVPVSVKWPLVIFTDSRYCLNALTVWVHGWLESGWKTANGLDVSNKEIIIQCVNLINRHEQHHDLNIRWVRGHSGIPENEHADWYASDSRRNKTTNWVENIDNRNR